MLTLKTILRGLKINGFQMRFLNLVHNVSNGMVKAQFVRADLCRKLCKPHCLGMSYYVNFLGGLGNNEFHIK